MARDTIDSTPITGVAELAATLEAGCKPADAFRIGTEHEKFGFNLADLSPIPYEGPRGIECFHRLTPSESNHVAGPAISTGSPCSRSTRYT